MAIGPINYLPNHVDLSQKVARGLQLGDLIYQSRQQSAMAQQAEQYRTDLQAAIQSNDPSQLVKLAAKYPQQGAGLKQAWEMLEEGQRKSELNAAMQGWYAINSGRTDVALQVLDTQIDALKNAGKDVSKLNGLREAIERDPASAAQNIGLLISTVAPKEFADSVARLGTERRAQEKQPGEVEAQRLGNVKLNAEGKKAIADAETAAVKARFAEADAVKDLERKGWDIKRVQNDIDVAKQNVKIAALNASIGREANQIRREQLQLERDKAIQTRDETIRTKTGEVESARSSIDNFLNTADRILATPANVRESAMGPISSKLPTLTQDTADFEALVENLEAQAFVSQVPSMKGLGALSDAEGKKLAAALQNFSLKQSPKQLEANVREAQRLLQKARANIAHKYGVPDTVPDTPAAANATPASDIDALVKKYGG